MVERHETCSLAIVRRVAAMLDIDPNAVAAGDALPRGWQFVLLGADTRRSALRSDGFPGVGIAMPDLGLPRLMLAGRAVTVHADIPIGASVRRTSVMQSLRHKTNAAAPLAVMTLVHELHVDGHTGAAIVETQTYLLMSAGKAASHDAQVPSPPLQAQHLKTVVPDETLLFQYSALGFNSHRIHIDRAHAREVEGFPDLVVNGGLATLLLTEFARLDLGVKVSKSTARHVAPLFCNRPVLLAADRIGERWRLQAFDDRHRLAVDMEVDVE
jgi:3-methylfumaryl-CoA hydratase